MKPKMTFINLPVKDLGKSKALFSAVGFEFNPNYTDENAACLVINDNTFAMLLTEQYFKGFTRKEIADATKTTEVLIAISADSREQVDEIVRTAIANGGSEAAAPVDHGFMYQWSFQDADGHIWEVAYMDPSAAAGQ